MRSILCICYCIASFAMQAQKIYFPAKELADPAHYEQSISKLAALIIPLQARTDKAEYYNNLARLYFAKQDYPATIMMLDSIDMITIEDPSYHKIANFPYRISSMTLRSGKQEDFMKAYKQHFLSLYNGFPADGKDYVNEIYKKEDADWERNEFNKQMDKYKSGNSDSISLPDALNLVKQWNYVQVYTSPILAFAKAVNDKEQVTVSPVSTAASTVETGTVVSPDAITFIKNVTILDVEKQKLIPNATVGITGNMITSIDTRSKTNIPANATVIDGTGKYLMPGMTDAHVHFSQSGGLYTRPDAINLKKYMPYERDIEWGHNNMIDPLKRYLQNGITSVIDVGSTVNYLKLRNVFAGKSYAPAVYMTGPLITSFEPDAFKKLGDDEVFSLVATEDEARKAVQAELPYHPDFIKIWYIVLGSDKAAAARKFLPVVKATIDEAHKNNLKVAVHATERITAQLAVEAGCDFLVHSVDDEVIPDDFVKLLKSRNIILCPTLTVYNGYRNTFGQTIHFSADEVRMANPTQLGSLFDLRHIPEQKMIDAYKANSLKNAARNATQDSICKVNLKKLSDAGVRIAAGTDAGNIGTLHATSYFGELKAMQASGLSNWQVLQSATINPSYILNKEKETGSIAMGKKADMLLLNANPVDNIDNLKQISLVINKGNIIKPDTLIRETALTLVQRQLNAYNDHNLDAFMEPYADDVELYQFPDKLLSKGKEQMRKDYTFLNNVPNLHCEIKERIIQGNTIIDKESVTGFGPKPVEATAIYNIENNKIKKVYFIF